MYFSIPDLTEISTNQQTYTLFNIHLNGIHFCSLRYSQLRKFHNELQRLIPQSLSNLPIFPPKKFFHLSERELDERRLLLERYLQSIAQNKSIISTKFFNNFFLNSQCETMDQRSSENISLNIQFLNENENLIENLPSENSTNQIFDICLKKFQIDDEYQTYFALFFYEKQEHHLNLIRPLFSFESPYFSLLQTQKSHPNVCIIFQKSYWDLNYDLKLIDNQQTCHLLYIQSIYDIKQSQDYCSEKIFEQLKIYQEEHSIKEYIRLARTWKFYGYHLLRNCSITTRQTEKISSCLLAIGNYELNCYFYNEDQTSSNRFSKELSFKVTRIRCWKVNWTKDDLNLAFEYLIRKDTLQWIIIHSEQAPLISTCLQAMIDEILAKKMGATDPVSTILDISNHRTNNNQTNGLIIRTQSDLHRFNNNKIFDEGAGDDDL